MTRNPDCRVRDSGGAPFCGERHASDFLSLGGGAGEPSCGSAAHRAERFETPDAERAPSVNGARIAMVAPLGPPAVLRSPRSPSRLAHAARRGGNGFGAELVAQGLQVCLQGLALARTASSANLQITTRVRGVLPARRIARERVMNRVSQKLKTREAARAQGPLFLALPRWLPAPLAAWGGVVQARLSLFHSPTPLHSLTPQWDPHHCCVAPTAIFSTDPGSPPGRTPYLDAP